MTPIQNNYPVTIGAGGAGGVSATNGTSGGNSVFVSLIAAWWRRWRGKVGITNTNGGNGGVPSTGDIRITGGNGGDGQFGNIKRQWWKAEHCTGVAVDAQALAVALAVRHMVQAEVVHTMPVIAEPV